MQKHIEHNNDERRHFFGKIYLSLYLKGLCVRGSRRTSKDCNILTSPAPPDIAVCLSRSPGLLNRRPGGPALCCVLFSQSHHFSNSFDPQARLISKLIELQTAQSGVPRPPSAGCCFLYSIIFQLF